MENLLEQADSFVRNEMMDCSTKGDKAVRAVSRALAAELMFAGIDFKTFQDDYYNGNIIDVSFLINEGHYKWIDYVSPAYQGLAKALFEVRSVGIGTPRAASGEGEFMLFALSNKCTKPSKGDVKVGDNLIEFKNDQPQLSASVTGQQFRTKTIELAGRYGIEPEMTRFKAGHKPTLKLYHKSSHAHYNKQIADLGDAGVEFFMEFYALTKAFTADEAEAAALKTITEDGYSYQSVIENICIAFSKEVDNDPADYMAMFRDDEVVVFPMTSKEYERLFTNGTLTPVADYFRLGAGGKIGYYYGHKALQ